MVASLAAVAVNRHSKVNTNLYILACLRYNMVSEKSKQGTRNRAAGKRFEDKTRKDLESKGFIVDRWTNNVELFIDKEWADIRPGDCKFKREGKLVPATPKIRMAKLQFGFGPILMNAFTGFPDFVAIKRLAIPDEFRDKGHNGLFTYDVVGVECKVNGTLDKEEKEKCDWLLKQGVFSKILIASKNGREVIYTEWKT